VCNSRGYGTASVVQHALALILALSVRLPEYRATVAAGRWQASPVFCLLDHPIAELAGRVLGIVGFGTLGRGVASVASALGMDVRVAQRPGGEPQENRVPLASLLPMVDVLSLHCPLTEHTHGLIGAAELRAMKPTALLINTARGALVDEGALADALRTGEIAGAGVDVLSVEPPPPDHPLLAPDVPNLILTPHIAWAARESRQRLADDVAANIEAFIAGEPRNRVA
jgi:glycerate dehydrogenase